MTGDESLVPFEWYNSGRFWYCYLRRPDGTKGSGCGKTKPKAVEDARKDLKRQDRLRQGHREHKKTQRELGRFVGQFLLERLNGKEAGQE